MTFLFLFRGGSRSNTYKNDGCKRLFCVNVKDLYWFAFEQNERTPVPLDVLIDSLIYFVINAQLYF